VSNLLPHPFGRLRVARPEEQKEIALVDPELDSPREPIARLEAQHVLEVCDADGRQHLHPPQHLVAVSRRVRDEGDLVAGGILSLWLARRGPRCFRLDRELELDVSDWRRVEVDGERADDRPVCGIRRDVYAELRRLGPATPDERGDRIVDLETGHP